MEVLSTLWTEVVTRPMTNGLVFFYAVLGSNFGIAIIFFTIVTRILMYPLTMRQLNSTKKMQLIQPRIKELQEKYKNDRTRLSKEQMALFKEAGVNPLGCLGPMIIQLPIWIGLYSAIRAALASNPENLIDLSTKLYSWLPFVNEAIPLKSHFLWMDLGQPDPSVIVMPVLVGASMYLVQKMSTLPSTDPRQASMNNMMAWMFPLMFGFWTLTFPSGLAIYWVISNFISIVLQYRVTGWGGLVKQPAPVPAVVAEQPRRSAAQVRTQPPVIEGSLVKPPENLSLSGRIKRIFLGSQPAPPPGTIPEASVPGQSKPAAPAVKEEGAHGNDRNDRQDSRGRARQGPQPARSRPRRGRGRRRR